MWLNHGNMCGAYSLRFSGSHPYRPYLFRRSWTCEGGNDDIQTWMVDPDLVRDVFVVLYWTGRDRSGCVEMTMNILKISSNRTVIGEHKDRLEFTLDDLHVVVSRYENDNERAHVIVDLPSGDSLSEIMPLSEVDEWVLSHVDEKKTERMTMDPKVLPTMWGQVYIIDDDGEGHYEGEGEPQVKQEEIEEEVTQEDEEE